MRGHGQRITARIAAAWVLGAACATTGGCTDESPRAEPDAPTVSAVEREQLEALGYVQWSEQLDALTAEKSGVTIHDRTKVHAGLNLWSREHGQEAYLIDMEGNLLHEWSSDAATGWAVVFLQPGGDLLVVARHDAVLKLDFDSNVLWNADMWAHHDLTLDENGLIYALRNGREFEPAPGGRLPIVSDGLAILDDRGRVIREIDFNPLFPEAAPGASPEEYDAYIAATPQAVKGERRGKAFLDTLHSNSVTVLPRDVAGLGRASDLLISMRRTSTIAVLDPQGEKVLWRWGPGEILRQHHPTLLENGNLLVFDNGSRDRRWSRIVEYSPAEDRIDWEYKADPPEDFYCNARGSAQMLPNGNVLITDSSSGTVFEVTREGEKVWEFVNPRLRVKGKRVQRETIYRMTRLSPELVASLPLARAHASGSPLR